MLLSEWRVFPSAPCLAGKKDLMTVRVSILLKSRAFLSCFRACFLPGRAKDLSASRYITICSLSDSTIFFHIISKTARFSGKSYWKQNVCFDFLYNFEIFLILRRIHWATIINVSCISHHVKYPLLTYLRQVLKYQILWQSVQWVSSFSMQTDGQTRRN